jgi:hypothetical protein
MDTTARAREHPSESARGALATMLRDIRALAEDIGIRFMGSDADARAAKYLAGRFAELGLAPEIMVFPVMGWSLREAASLEVIPDSGEIWWVECYPYVYSASTPEGGARGRILPAGRQELFGMKFRPFERPKFRFRKYSIRESTGVVIAQIVSRDFPVGARPAPWGVLPLPRTMPTVMIGEEDGRRLEHIVARIGYCTAATLRIASQFKPDAFAANVIARLPGTDPRKAEEHILVTAHFDTQYTGPGAVDNASGVAAVLALAEHFGRERLEHSLLFALYTGEEVGFVGARQHLAALKESADLSSIRAVLNLDMLACNEPNWIHASADFLAQESTRRASATLAIAEKYGAVEIVTPCWPSGDQDPFDDEGIPCVSFTWKGYKYRYTHTPDDTLDKIDEAVLADSFALARHVVVNMDKML